MEDTLAPSRATTTASLGTSTPLTPGRYTSGTLITTAKDQVSTMNKNIKFLINALTYLTTLEGAPSPHCPQTETRLSMRRYCHGGYALLQNTHFSAVSSLTGKLSRKIAIFRYQEISPKNFDIPGCVYFSCLYFHLTSDGIVLESHRVSFPIIWFPTILRSSTKALSKHANRMD